MKLIAREIRTTAMLVFDIRYSDIRIHSSTLLYCTLFLNCFSVLDAKIV